MNCLKISKDTKGIKIKEYSSLRRLINDFGQGIIDFFFLTTIKKYIIEIIKKNFVNIIGIGGISESIIRAKFDSVYKNNVSLGKYFN